MHYTSIYIVVMSITMVIRFSTFSLCPSVPFFFYQALLAHILLQFSSPSLVRQQNVLNSDLRPIRTPVPSSPMIVHTFFFHQAHWWCKCSFLFQCNRLDMAIPYQLFFELFRLSFLNGFVISFTCSLVIRSLLVTFFFH